MKTGRRAVAALSLAATLGLTACHGTPSPSPTAAPTRTPAWQQVSLPVPAGSRAVIRSSAICGDRWYLGGSTATAAGAFSPVIWTSSNQRDWTTLPINPVSYYGKQNTIGLLGCQADHVAAIGWQVGGAHGFPRYSGWFPDARGTLQEVDIPYTLFAGPEGVNVTGIAVSPRGWVLSGNRSSGAAAWHSTTGQTYTLVDHAPNLATSAAQYTWAGGVAATPTGWVIIGAVTGRSSTASRDPAVWTSTDAVTWTPVPVPGSPAFEDPEQVTVVGSTIVMIGLRGNGFGVWRGTTQGDWSRVAQLGDNGEGAGAATSLVSTESHLFATTSAQAFSLWQSDDMGANWHTLGLPSAAPNKAGTDTFVVSDQRQLLLIIDDGQSSRAWLDPDAATGE